MALPLLRAGPALKLGLVAQGLVQGHLQGWEFLSHVSGCAVVRDHPHDEELPPFALLEFAMLQLMPIALRH